MIPVSTLAYYVSAHGYGHGVRSCDILRALAAALHPDVRIVLVTDLPDEFLRHRLGGAAVERRRGSFDVGMVQLDSIRVDVPATLERVRSLHAERPRLVESEAGFLRRERVSAVVADIPSIPIEAAARAGVPAMAVGNFAWNWIYEEFAAADPRWAPLVAGFEEGYRRADLLLRLPFAEPMDVFPRREDIPIVASPGRARRDELAEMTGCRADRPWVLLSFTTLEWDSAALDAVERLEGHEFFTVLPLRWRRRNIHPVDRRRMPFSDVLASVDVVVSKPGFGLLSECVVNGKPLIYADRSDFREYAVLVEAMKGVLRQWHIPSDQLYRGELGPSLEAVRNQPPPSRTMAGGGDEIAARRIAGFFR